MLSSEIAFKVLAGILFVLYAAIRAYFQRTVAGSPVVHAQHERRERLLHLCAQASGIPVILYVLTPWIDAFYISSGVWVRWVGAAAVVSGLVLFYWEHRSLGTNWSATLELRDCHSLTSDGPYRFIRHPMYATFLLIAVGLALLTANLLVWLHFVVVVVMYLVRVQDEERMMLERFGSAYARYCEHTGRLLPPIRMLWRSQSNGDLR